MEMFGFVMLVIGIASLIAAIVVYILAMRLNEESAQVKRDAQKILEEAKNKQSEVTQKIIEAVAIKEIVVEELTETAFNGLPVDDDTPNSVLRSLKAHGFAFHWNPHASRAIGLNYVNPKTPDAEIMREVYSLPVNLMVANNLHEDARAQAAFWAARQFKMENAEKAPELAQYAYL